MKKNTRRILTCVFLLSLAVALITVGLMRGEARTVLKKAVRICMECIGLG
ncbi:MAG: hypothetical protein II054_04905 [Treponema sp.]|nr:hypothetical protein [Treponema sp.]